MRFHAKAFMSLLLSLAFLKLAFSGVILYLTPRGRVANWTGWTILGLSKEGWMSVHINVALLFLIVAMIHLILNWTMFWGYIKKGASLGLNMKLELAVAAVVAAVVLAGAIYQVPPFSTVMALNRQIKDSWEGWASDAPAPHAEEFTLERVAANMNLSANEVAMALQEAGFVVSNTSATVGQIAEANGVTPQDIYAAITLRFPEANHGGPGKGQGPGAGDHKPGAGPGKGMGRGMGKGMGGGGASVGRATSEPPSVANAGPLGGWSTRSALTPPVGWVGVCLDEHSGMAHTYARPLVLLQSDLIGHRNHLLEVVRCNVADRFRQE